VFFPRTLQPRLAARYSSLLDALRIGKRRSANFGYQSVRKNRMPAITRRNSLNTQYPPDDHPPLVSLAGARRLGESFHPRLQSTRAIEPPGSVRRAPPRVEVVRAELSILVKGPEELLSAIHAARFTCQRRNCIGEQRCGFLPRHGKALTWTKPSLPAKPAATRSLVPDQC